MLLITLFIIKLLAGINIYKDHGDVVDFTAARTFLIDVCLEMKGWFAACDSTNGIIQLPVSSTNTFHKKVTTLTIAYLVVFLHRII